MARVQVLEAEQGLPKDVLADVLAVVVAHASNDLSQGVVHDFDEDPQASLELVLLVNPQHKVIVHAHVHQRHFVVHQLLLTVVLEVLDKFERDDFSIALSKHFEYFSESARAELILGGDVVVA